MERINNSTEINTAFLAYDQWVEQTGKSDVTEFASEFGLSEDILNELRGLIDIVQVLPIGSADRNNPRDPVSVGPYRILRLLGSGGMGNIWLAEQDEPIRRQVALKLIRHSHQDATFRSRFEREQRALEKLDHPNIARILDASLENPHYIAMEYVQGMPLDQYCVSHAPFLNQRLELFLDLCSAVQFAHENGVVHRDLKPSNVMVSDRFEKPLVKLIDFGLAKIDISAVSKQDLKGVTREHMAVGSFLWMSPEQAKGSHQSSMDHRTDIFSLGAILYWLVTGTTPIPLGRAADTSPAELLQLIDYKFVERPSVRLANQKKTNQLGNRWSDATFKEYQQALRSNLDWVVLKALSRDVRQRYQHVSELVDDIRKHIAQRPVQARQSEWKYFFHSVLDRLKRPVTVAAMSTLMMLILTTVFIFNIFKATPIETVIQNKLDEAFRFNPYEGFDRKATSERLDEIRDKLDSLGQHPRANIVDFRGQLVEGYDQLGKLDEAIRQAKIVADSYERLGDPDPALAIAYRVSLAHLLFNDGQNSAAEKVVEKLESDFDDHISRNQDSKFNLDFLKLRKSIISGLVDERLIDLRKNNIDQWRQNPASLRMLTHLAVLLSHREMYEESARMLDEDRAAYEQVFAKERKRLLDFELARLVATRNPTKTDARRAKEIVIEAEYLLGSEHNVIVDMKIELISFLTRAQELADARKILDKELPASIDREGALHPQSVALLIRSSEVYSYERRFAEAAECLDSVVKPLGQGLPESFDDWAPIVYLTAQEWLLDKNYDRTIGLVDYALQAGDFEHRKPNLHFDLLPVLRAQALIGRFQFKEAVPDLRTFVDSLENRPASSESARTKFYLGQAYHGLEDFENAIGVLEEFCEQSIRNAWDYETRMSSKLLFDIFLETGQPEKAVEIAKVRLESLDKTQNVLSYFAWLLNFAEASAKLGDFSTAKSHLDSALQLNLNIDGPPAPTPPALTAQIEIIRGLIARGNQQEQQAMVHFHNAAKCIPKVDLSNLSVFRRCQKVLK